MDVSEPFLALVIYPTTAEGQVWQDDNLVKLATEQVRLLPGFLRARVLLSEDGESLTVSMEQANAAGIAGASWADPVGLGPELVPEA